MLVDFLSFFFHKMTKNPGDRLEPETEPVMRFGRLRLGQTARSGLSKCMTGGVGSKRSPNNHAIPYGFCGNTLYTSDMRKERMSVLFSLFASFAIFFSFFPLSAAAQTEKLSAGFPEAPLWLSSTDVTDGDAVKIYSVLYNASGASVSGTISFTVDTKTISSDPFTLAAGATQIESAPWSATAGTHTFGAEIESTASTSALTNQKTSSVTLVVKDAPPPPAAVEALTTATAAANSAITTATPVIASAANNVFAATENIRNAGTAYLESKLAGETDTGKAKGEVLGAETYNAPAAAPAAAASGLPGFFSSALTAIERFFLAIFSSTWLFYPFFLVLILLLLWFLLRRFGRSRS